METTLRALAIQHARGEITALQVRENLSQLSPVIKRQEGDDTWYEGNQDNTITSVQALIGDEITLEQFNAFADILTNSTR